MSAISSALSALSLPRALALPQRKRRKDSGQGRLHPDVEAKLHQLLSTNDRPPMAWVHRQLSAFSTKLGCAAPSRASLYNAIARVPVPTLPVSSLPAAVQLSLYNLAPEARGDGAVIPGDQIVFYAFNYGAPGAISFASGLPWVCLRRARERRGWRPKSRALLEAVIAYRGA